ncbi:hypothetical protein LWC05_01705 [Acetobacter sicerae]|uniref:Transposase n=1 Tax=Acetobacter sicerae TaxID=85325 RepID=A0ABS8VSZ6_9PROT|nr:hypothetical protein [Acetobacter sicerae]MCE0742614.1 hypothetical protein [Acetobacter sicerae]
MKLPEIQHSSRNIGTVRRPSVRACRLWLLPDPDECWCLPTMLGKRIAPAILPR